MTNNDDDMTYGIQRPEEVPFIDPDEPVALPIEAIEEAPAEVAEVIPLKPQKNKKKAKAVAPVAVAAPAVPAGVFKHTSTSIPKRIKINKQTGKPIEMGDSTTFTQYHLPSGALCTNY